MNEIVFNCSMLEFIKVVSEEEFHFAKIDFFCSKVTVYFVSHNNEFIIGQESAVEIFQSFIGNLKKTINNNLQLDKSIIKNLGLMENQYWNESQFQKKEFIMVNSSDGSSKYWIGSRYEIWNFNGKGSQSINVWLYNDDNGNIIFEVTPLYQWSFLPDEPENPDFQTYEEFMKDYKPLITRVIPRQVAIEWLGQAMKVYRGLFPTEELYIDFCKKLGWKDC
ncbi:hypothetical protein KBC04_01970 [Candidatus Babeliales bacterium]|nr:hypothetical protein [Candidatus Babeliales bacterium]MBP9843824.1 hypothetical protein [Candidatus Babeliales bacterium]